MRDSYIYASHKAERGLVLTDLVILNHGQVTQTIPELEPPSLTSTPHLPTTDLMCNGTLYMAGLQWYPDRIHDMPVTSP
ncbi:hypothetical protein TNCV_1692411 [Trichonephila clavipes]|nr:hypothetical protein TNCV_1692411 [Trichonephila clavipes]